MAGNLFYPDNVGAHGLALRMTFVWDFNRRDDWMAAQTLLTSSNIGHWADENFTQGRCFIVCDVFSAHDIAKLIALSSFITETE